MNYIIFDLEWNQPYSNDVSFIKRTHMHITGEIIQIGAVKLDENKNIVDTFTCMIRPKYLRHMNQHVKKLTGMTTEDIDQGIPFLVAYGRFNRWCGTDAIMLSWGPDDIMVLKDNLILHGLTANIERSWYDAQMIYASVMHGNQEQLSLQKAMEELSVGDQGLDAHDALHDSLFTAHVLQKMPWKHSLAYYGDQLQSSSMSLHYGNPLSFIMSRYYDDKKAVWKDRRTSQCQCPLCNEPMEPTKRERLTGDKYLAFADCPRHGRFAIQWRIGKCTHRYRGIHFYVSQTTSLSRKDLEVYYEERAALNRIKEAKYLEKRARALEKKENEL